HLRHHGVDTKARKALQAPAGSLRDFSDALEWIARFIFDVLESRYPLCDLDQEIDTEIRYGLGKEGQRCQLAEALIEGEHLLGREVLRGKGDDGVCADLFGMLGIAFRFAEITFAALHTNHDRHRSALGSLDDNLGSG